MEAIAMLLLIGVAAYFILRHTTKSGTNTVRAYLYLRAINGGFSVREANQIAQVDLTTSSQHILGAREYVRTVYDGKQLPMIADSRKLGLLLDGAAVDTRTPPQTSRQHPARTRSATDDDRSSFDAYDAIFVAEVKRLSGKTSAELHWVELTDDTDRRRAFSDGVEPKALALAFHKYAEPPPI